MADAGNGSAESRHADEVARNQVWRETIEKELRSMRLTSHFSINPKTVVPITEKPQDAAFVRRYRKKPEERITVDGLMAERERAQAGGEAEAEAEAEPVAAAPEDEEEDEVAAELLATIKRADRVPNERSFFPRTAAEEIGWDNEPLVARAGKRRMYHGRKLGEVTKYADHYTAMVGHTPWSSGDANKGASAAKKG